MLCCREFLALQNDYLRTYIETCNKFETAATVELHIQF